MSPNDPQSLLFSFCPWASAASSIRVSLLALQKSKISDASEILDFCKANKLTLIEDAAEAHGQKENNKLCGSFGDMSTFSFYANKHITTGEGGIVLTDDEGFYKNLKQINGTPKHLTQVKCFGKVIV